MEKWKKNLKEIKHYPSYLQRKYFPIHTPFEYKKLLIPFGRYHPFYSEEKNKICRMDFTEADVILIFGARGAGKSFLIGDISSRGYKSDIIPVFVDIKAEYATSFKPLQQQFVKSALLLENEISEGINIVNLVPYFILKTGRSFSFPYETIQINFDELTLDDFLTLVNRDFTDTQKEALNNIFTLKEEGEINTFEDFFNKLKNMEGFSVQTVKPVEFGIKRLIDKGVIGDQFDFNVVEHIRNGKGVNLILKGILGSGEDTVNYYVAYVALLLRKILKGKDKGQISKKLKIMIVVDEASYFAPNHGEPCSKKEIHECVDRGRFLGLSMMFSVQTFTRISPTVFEQTRYIFLPHNIHFPTMVEVFKQKALLDESPIMYKTTLTQYHKDMKLYRGGQRDWMFIDNKSKEWYLFRPLAPLFYHLSEG